MLEKKEIPENWLLKYVELNYQTKYSVESVPEGCNPFSKKYSDETISQFCKDIFAVQLESPEAMYPNFLELRERYLSGVLSLCEWVYKKAIKIERCTGLIEYSTDLIDIAEQKQIWSDEMSDLRKELSHLSVIVYDLSISISYSDFSSMSPYEKFAAVLDEENIVHNLITLKESGYFHSQYLKDWLYDISKIGHLQTCLKVFAASKDNHFFEEEDLTTIALECCYKCEIATSPILGDMYQILEIVKGDDRTDNLQRYLRAANILKEYNIFKPLNYFLKYWNEDNIDNVRQLIIRITLQASKSTRTNHRKLQKDLIDLTELIFPFIPSEFCTSQFVKSLLLSGKFGLAKEYINECLNKENIVLSAAIEHFNSSPSSGHVSMGNAAECLSMIKPPTREIVKELNLIEAVKKLFRYGIQDLPVQIRLSKNKLEYIPKLLKQHPHIFSKSSEVVEIGALLGFDSSDDELLIIEMCAQEAYSRKEYEYCFDLCSLLIKKSFQPAWSLCNKLGLQDEYHNSEARKELIGFSMVHIPPDELEYNLKVWQILDSETSNQAGKRLNVGNDVKIELLKSYMEEVGHERSLTFSHLASKIEFLQLEERLTDIFEGTNISLDFVNRITNNMDDINNIVMELIGIGSDLHVVKLLCTTLNNINKTDVNTSEGWGDDTDIAFSSDDSDELLSLDLSFESLLKQTTIIILNSIIDKEKDFPAWLNEIGEKQLLFQVLLTNVLSLDQDLIGSFDSGMRTVLENGSIPSSIKIFILTNLIEHIDPVLKENTEKDEALLELYKTQNIISSISTTNDEINIETQDDKISLFQDLVTKSTQNDLEQLSNLLVIWSTEGETERNDWIINCYNTLYLKASTFGDMELIKFRYFSLNITISEETEREILDTIEDESTRVKYALLSNHENLREEFIKEINTDMFEDQELVSLVLRRGYIDKFAQGPVYHKLVSTLLLNNNLSENPSETEKSIVVPNGDLSLSLEYSILQLCNEEYWIHAGLLALAKYSVPSSYRTVLNGVKILDKCLNDILDTPLTEDTDVCSMISSRDILHLGQSVIRKFHKSEYCLSRQ
eukprot:TRINITY_DN5099_c0_g1_i2.p1 TRINITY_DN5099_c0_g1~~TRINITY_DN5099_c0_g1_i2.p1  ORF type:complete len:1067 (+),score=222.89 TRINITY_DN5099_c0_g1_i2:2011-5211(+)